MRLVVSAINGDDEAFQQLTAPYRREILLHCYRMLGSLHDADDLLQEALLRAWRRLGTFEGRSPFRAWLYRIATNAGLDALDRRPRRILAQDYGPPADPRLGAHVTPLTEIPWLEPFPDGLLPSSEGVVQSPEAQYAERQGVELAFLAAIQWLPARQRAVLILRDVLGWRASEVAAVLETSVKSVNSALQRARASIEDRLPRESKAEALRPSDERERELVRRYMGAWENADLPALVKLLKDDVIAAMPPLAEWYSGRKALETYLELMWFRPEARGRLGFRLTAANRQPAMAIYKGEPAGRKTPFAIMVLRFDGDLVAESTAFCEPSLFEHFDLPAFLER